MSPTSASNKIHTFSQNIGDNGFTSLNTKTRPHLNFQTWRSFQKSLFKKNDVNFSRSHGATKPIHAFKDTTDKLHHTYSEGREKWEDVHRQKKTERNNREVQNVFKKKQSSRTGNHQMVPSWHLPSMSGVHPIKVNIFQYITSPFHREFQYFPNVKLFDFHKKKLRGVIT